MLDYLRSVFARRETRATLASAEALALFGAAATAAGVSVTAETALQSPTTLAACRAIAEGMGALPFHLYRRGADGARERATDHPAARLLAGDWCPWAGGVETRTTLQLDALLHGSAFAIVVRTGTVPRELHRIDPRTVSVDTTGAEPRFKVATNGVNRFVDHRDMLRIPTPGSTIDRSLCLIQLAREAIAVDLVMARHQARLFGNGARPAGVLKYGKTLSDEVLKRLRNSFAASHAGGENSGRTLILEDGISFDPLQFSSVDSQFLELRRLAGQEIGRVFRVPGTLLGDLERATWRNVPELMRQFVQTCLMPWAEVWQSGLERALLTPAERAEYFVEAVFDDLIRGDLPSRFTAYRQATGGAWLTPNEVRALDNRPPIDGGDQLIRQAGQAGAEDGTPAPPAKSDQEDGTDVQA